MQQPAIHRAEILLLLFFASLAAIALCGPALPNPPHAHDFADARTLWGLPHALDVLSNLPFALAGCAGLLVLRRVPHAAISRAERACATLFFAGLVVTAACSASYHWVLDDAGLAVDRLGMSVAFAGLLGLLAATHVSERAGMAAGAALLVLAPASVAAWFFGGNVLPWAVVQFGAMPLLVAAVFLRPRPGALRIGWVFVLLAYALAKLAEAQDHAVFAATGELFSGHTLKHVVAAFAAWPVIVGILARAGRQNVRTTAGQAA